MMGHRCSSEQLRRVGRVVGATAGEDEEQRSERTLIRTEPAVKALRGFNQLVLCWQLAHRERLTVPVAEVFALLAVLYDPVSRLCCEPLPRSNLSRIGSN